MTTQRFSVRVRAASTAVPACPVCACAIPRRHLMCPRHWHLVPQPLQKAVYSTFKRLNFRESDRAGALQQVTAYRTAADAAIDFVVSLEVRPDPVPAANLSVPSTAHQEQTT